MAAAEKTFERIETAAPPEELLPLLGQLEDEGAFGMTLEWSPERVRVRAWKGKEGPCYETGRSASYAGPCLAVGDDDHHFLAGTLRMCEKTAQVYRSEPYRRWLQVTDPDPALVARLDTDPVPFDCDTLARDAEHIAEQVTADPEPAEVTAVYLGPFRYVVLSNGTTLRRGLPAAVSRAHARLLAEEGQAAVVDLAAPPAPNFLALYRAYGPLFLVGRGAGKTPIRMPDFSALEGLTPAVRERLGKTIERSDDYFMLQGTDPQEGGCCPLPAVGDANRLAEAGILDAWVSPLSPECPMTVYALAGEIGEVRHAMPRFYKNELLRRTVAARLRREGPS
ncbi:MAG: hypothetical protein Kow0092_22250 [Deferrisomatales bacterium]